MMSDEMIFSAPSGAERAQIMKSTGPNLLRFLVVASAIVCGCASATAQQIDNQTFLTTVNVEVVPIAEISLIGNGLLALKVPPAASTIPSTGVNFRVIGNASASLVAEPSDFVTIPTLNYPTGEVMGRAVLNGNSLGYRLRLDFPSVGVEGSDFASAALPGYKVGPTQPPLSVNLTAFGGERLGSIHLVASHEWTPTGGLPPPGVYVGEVILTVTAY
jgi:hypothetical protein